MTLALFCFFGVSAAIQKYEKLQMFILGAGGVVVVKNRPRPAARDKHDMRRRDNILRPNAAVRTDEVFLRREIYQKPHDSKIAPYF